MSKQKMLFILMIALGLNACAKKGSQPRPSTAIKPAATAPSAPPPDAAKTEVPPVEVTPPVAQEPTETATAETVQPEPNRPSQPQAKPGQVSRATKQKMLSHAVFGKSNVIRCRFEPTGVPMSFLEYHINTRVAYTTTGWPQVTRVYKDVRLTNTLPPYKNTGVTLLAFVDSPLIHIKRGGMGRIWYETGVTYPFEATWGLQPGAPTREARLGVCWTPEEPASTPDHGG